MSITNSSLPSVSPSFLPWLDVFLSLLHHPFVLQIFGPGAIEELFSTDWKARETALSHLSREAITLLLPQLTSKTQVGLGGGEDGSEGVRGVQDVCMQVVAYSCNDSVLKVFLAALVRGECVGVGVGGGGGRRKMATVIAC